MASKTRKITKAPSGASFMYAPKPPAEPLTHSFHKCAGTITDAGPNRHPGANRPDARTYACECGREWPSGKFQHALTRPTEHHVISEVVKKQAQKKMPRELQNAVGAEVRRRMEILTAEREKFPPSLLKKGKRWVPNPKFTNKMRDHIHRFYVSSEEIYDALKNDRELPEYPLPEGV